MPKAPNARPLFIERMKAERLPRTAAGQENWWAGFGLSAQALCRAVYEPAFAGIIPS